jgi:hypothetical protein
MTNTQIADTARCLHTGVRGIANLLASLHVDPALRTWVPAETTALVPVPEADGRCWTLWSLLAEPVGQGVTRLAYRPAWGAVQWDLSSGRARQRLRLAAAVLPSGAAGLWSVRTGGDVPGRREALLARLVEVLDTRPEEAGFRHLAALSHVYHGLLPVPAYAAYHALVPGSAAWLLPPP